MSDPKTDPIPAPEPATPTVAAPAPMNLAAESISLLAEEVCRALAATACLCMRTTMARPQGVRARRARADILTGSESGQISMDSTDNNFCYEFCEASNTCELWTATTFHKFFSCDSYLDSGAAEKKGCRVCLYMAARMDANRKPLVYRPRSSLFLIVFDQFSSTK